MVARCHYHTEQPSQYPWWNPWTKEYHILARSTGKGGKEEEMEKKTGGHHTFYNKIPTWEKSVALTCLPIPIAIYNLHWDREIIGVTLSSGSPALAAGFTAISMQTLSPCSSAPLTLRSRGSWLWGSRNLAQIPYSSFFLVLEEFTGALLNYSLSTLEAIYSDTFIL